MWRDDPPDLRPGDGAEIVRHAAQADLALVYLHGFTATKWEIDPVHRRVAERLGANLVLTRLAGHGQDGAALARVRSEDWLGDLDAALALARTLGRRTVLIGTSTGGLLAAMAAARGEDLAGVVLLSPNFALNRRYGWLLRLPGIFRWGPRVLGRTRRIASLNPEHEAHWTLRYPTAALRPLVGLMRRPVPLGAARIPALFLWSDADRVISPRAVRRAAALWGGPVTLRPLVPVPGDDPMHHIPAGDILSPGGTQALTEIIADWIAALP
ncbi:alpha/beta hydrolase [Falsirhodobacter algicola]|uniref:Alpha/beta fold hydrolase n=1 Tax=Falsirhodobacter algicola TaxID=2692330 RepID=A0A8J8MT40_9RHOB|nr:alpha/beta fold hydrolase [Falsirhodobacter algicola]QUS35828.1 alpha/beta fold hydrolase [Falsirhodobacter algicola]